MEHNQPHIEQHAGGDCRHHHFAFTPTLNVVAGQDHRRNFKTGSRAHQYPRQAIRQAKIATDPQRHIDDIHRVAGPHQRRSDKQHAHVFIAPAAFQLRQAAAFLQLRHSRHRRQLKGNQRQADDKNPGGNGEHGRKAIIQRQHKSQRWANDPRQRQLGAHHRAEHHHFAGRAIGVFAGEGKQLRHRRISDRSQHDTAGNKRQIMAVESEQQRVTHCHQAAEHN